MCKLLTQKQNYQSDYNFIQSIIINIQESFTYPEAFNTIERILGTREEISEDVLKEVLIDLCQEGILHTVSGRFYRKVCVAV